MLSFEAVSNMIFVGPGFAVFCWVFPRCSQGFSVCFPGFSHVLPADSGPKSPHLRHSHDQGAAEGLQVAQDALLQEYLPALKPICMCVCLLMGNPKKNKIMMLSKYDVIRSYKITSFMMCYVSFLLTALLRKNCISGQLLGRSSPGAAGD